MRLYSYRRAPAIRWGVPVVLCASVLLTACEEDNYRPDPEPGEPTVTETSAPVALNQSTESYFAAPKIINYWPQLADQAFTGSCHFGNDEGSGDMLVQTDSNDRAVSTAYNDCKLSYGPGAYSLNTGVVNYGYDDAGNLVKLSMEEFSEELSFGNVHQIVEFDGTIDFPGPISSPPSYLANGRYKFQALLSSDKIVELSFQDFQVQSSVSGTDIIQIMNGGISLPDSDRYLTVDTGSDGLRRPSGSSCAVSGTLTLTAADGSYTSATFNGEDHIVVSVNGVAQPERTCDEYLAFINH
ncbi:MAG: hypothetical protein ABGX87_11695 [Alcanivorax sp.]|uniref:hypothetical protein n=1 Tax=Alloalcanivorax marinus TaxID=1177169 RepID=UPI001959B35B|nr:hypothetical protein [Alloalcanivorax marinus]MBM7334685.1 hypothetical protein [Alloalcanivorax marinus]